MLPRRPTGIFVIFLIMAPFDFQAHSREQIRAIQVFVEGAIVSLLAIIALSDICGMKHSITSCATGVVFPALQCRPSVSFGIMVVFSPEQFYQQSII